MTEKNVREFRTVYTVENYAEAVRFYRDALGLPMIEEWNTPNGSGIVLEAGRAILELLSPEMTAYVDHIEAGGRAAGPVRIAVEFPDADQAARRLVTAGAIQIAPAVTTPWKHRNVRTQAPDGMAITLFSKGE